MEKEEIINLIKGRIEDEQRKHPLLDWSRIAAIKIYTEWFEYFDNENQELKEDMADKKYTEEDMLKCWNTYGYNNGYNQCKKDMANKKYTEEDMIKFAFDTYCYISGIMKVPFNQVSENRTHAEENLKVFINSLNKQD